VVDDLIIPLYIVWSNFSALANFRLFFSKNHTIFYFKNKFYVSACGYVHMSSGSPLTKGVRGIAFYLLPKKGCKKYHYFALINFTFSNLVIFLIRYSSFAAKE